MLKKIAITGNLGAGKSEALKIFKKLGSYVVDTDKIAHNLLLYDKELQYRIVNFLGKGVLKNSELDRNKIAKIIFNDDNKLNKFEKLIHPKIINEIEKQYNKVKNQNFEFFVVEMVLLFEINFQSYFDSVILITTKDSIAKKRYKDKDYTLRIKRQIPSIEKEKFSDFVIINDENISVLEDNIKKISKNLKTL